MGEAMKATIVYKTSKWRTLMQRISLYVLCLFVTHIVAESLHHALVTHVTCPEHGEQIHHDHANGQDSHANHEEYHHEDQKLAGNESLAQQDSDGVARFKQDSRTRHSHHVCQVCVDERKQKQLFPKRSTLRLHRVAKEPCCAKFQSNPIASSEPLYRMAPKMSPPTCV